MPQVQQPTPAQVARAQNLANLTGRPNPLASPTPTAPTTPTPNTTSLPVPTTPPQSSLPNVGTPTPLSPTGTYITPRGGVSYQSPYGITNPSSPRGPSSPSSPSIPTTGGAVIQTPQGGVSYATPPIQQKTAQQKLDIASKNFSTVTDTYGKSNLYGKSYSSLTPVYGEMYSPTRTGRGTIMRVQDLKVSQMPTSESVAPKTITGKIAETYKIARLNVPFLARTVPTSKEYAQQTSETTIGRITGLNVNLAKKSSEERLKQYQEAVRTPELKAAQEQYRINEIQKQNMFVQAGMIDRKNADLKLAQVGVIAPSEKEIESKKVLLGYDTQGKKVYSDKSYGEIIKDKSKEYQNEINKIQNYVDEGGDINLAQTQAQQVYNKYSSEINSIPSPTAEYKFVSGNKPTTLLEYQYLNAPNKFAKASVLVSSASQKAAEMYYGSKILDVGAFQPVSRTIQEAKGLLNTGRATDITLKTLGYTGGSLLLAGAGYEAYKSYKSTPQELKPLKLADITGGAIGFTSFLGEKNVLPIRYGVVTTSELSGAATKESLYLKVPFKEKVIPLITRTTDRVQVIDLTTGKVLTEAEIAKLPINADYQKAKYELGYGKEFKVSATTTDLTTRGFQPSTELQLAFEKKFVTPTLTQQEQLLREESIKGLKAVYNTPIKDTGSLLVENSKSISALNPKGKEILIKELQGEGGTVGERLVQAFFNRGTERFYGSITIDAEGGFRYNVARLNPKTGAIETGDTDIQRRKYAIKYAEQLYNKLKNAGADVRWTKDTGLIQVKDPKTGEYRNLLDIHGPDLPDLAMGEIPLGFKSQPTKGALLEGKRIPIQRLTESSAQKLAGVLEIRTTPEGKFTYQPREGQEKGITDFPSMLKRIADSAKSQEASIARASAEQYIKIQKVRYPEAKFDLNEPITFELGKIPTTNKPSISQISFSNIMKQPSYKISETKNKEIKIESLSPSKSISKSISPSSLSSPSKSLSKSISPSKSISLSISPSPSLISYSSLSKSLSKSISPSISKSLSPSKSPSRSPSPSISPPFISPPSFPSPYGRTSLSLGESTKFNPNRIFPRREPKYSASLGASIFGISKKVKQKDLAETLKRLGEREYSGIELRPTIQVVPNKPINRKLFKALNI